MPRVVKEHEYAVRRDEILDVAQRLVQTKGYEAMTIQDVLDGLGISKGAFYHYFGSKQALLEGIIERMLAEVEGRIGPVVNDPDLRALDKLHSFFAVAAAWKSTQQAFVLALLRVWYTDENALVRQKVRLLMVSWMTPLLTLIIEQGIREGVWSTPYPAQVAEVVLSLLQDFSDAVALLLLASDTAHCDLSRLQNTVAAYTDAIERVLRSETGSIQILDSETLRAWFVASRELVG